MPWPWTFLLRVVQQLGLGMPYSELLAPFLRHSLGSWISSLCTDRHRAASYIGIPSTYYGLSPTGSSTGRRMDGCIGIGRATTRVPFAEQYDLQWRSSRHWAKGPTDRVDFFVILRQVSRLSSCIEVIQLWYNSGIACLPKSTLLRQGVCVWNIWTDVKLPSLLLNLDYVIALSIQLSGFPSKLQGASAWHHDAGQRS